MQKLVQQLLERIDKNLTPRTFGRFFRLQGSDHVRTHLCDFGAASFADLQILIATYRRRLVTVRGFGPRFLLV